MWLVILESGHLLSRKLVVKGSGGMAGQIPWSPFLPFLLDEGFLLGLENHPSDLPRDGLRYPSLKVPMTDFLVIPGKTDVSSVELEGTNTLPTYAPHSSTGPDTGGLSERHCL